MATNVEIRRSNGSNYDEVIHFKTSVAIVEGLLDENNKIKASLLPSFVFGGMRFVTSISRPMTTAEIQDSFGEFIDANGGTMRGCYAIVTQHIIITASEGHAFVGVEEGFMPETPLSLEPSDWIIAVDDNGTTWAVINNTYQSASTSLTGIVKLATEQDGINGTSTTLAMTPKATVAAINEVLGDIDTALSNILISGGGETPADGDYLVRFFDYDGTILKEQWVNHGENATPPNLPDYTVATNKRPALTFQGWNNSYTNITGNKDIGATYIPTDGKTHAYVRLTKVSGKDVTLYLNKTDTSTLSIDWGDNITTTHTNNGNFNTSHTYSDYGDYEIKIWISSGSGEYGFGGGSDTTSFVGGAQQTQRNMLMYLFIGNNVSSIGSNAFRNCYSLTSIDLPAGVSSIGYSAFYDCYSLTSITIPESVSSIGNSAFGSCHSLTSISIPANLSSIGERAFQYCRSLTDIVIPESVSSIGSYAFNGCYSLTNINLPASVSSIGSSVFYQCYSLTSITIPDSVTSIGDRAFYYCLSLTSITIPDSVTSIGDRAFYYCFSLTSITIPDSVTSIGSSVFYQCYSLTSITIPESVSSIGESAFYDCRSILKYVFNRATPPTLASTNAFSNINSICKIYVPDESVNAYKSATNWITYADYIYPMSEMESD